MAQVFMVHGRIFVAWFLFMIILYKKDIFYLEEAICYETIWSPTLVCVSLSLPGVGQIHDSSWANESDIIIPETAACPGLIYSSDLQWQGALGDTLWLWVTLSSDTQREKGLGPRIVKDHKTTSNRGSKKVTHLILSITSSSLHLLKLTEIDKHCENVILQLRPTPLRDMLMRSHALRNFKHNLNISY